MSCRQSNVVTGPYAVPGRSLADATFGIGGVTGVKRLTTVPSRSRGNSDRLPQGRSLSAALGKISARAGCRPSSLAYNLGVVHPRPLPLRDEPKTRPPTEAAVERHCLPSMA
jgi:hypothetical protein